MDLLQTCVRGGVRPCADCQPRTHLKVEGVGRPQLARCAQQDAPVAEAQVVPHPGSPRPVVAWMQSPASVGQGRLPAGSCPAGMSHQLLQPGHRSVAGAAASAFSFWSPHNPAPLTRTDTPWQIAACKAAGTSAGAETATDGRQLQASVRHAAAPRALAAPCLHTACTEGRPLAAWSCRKPSSAAWHAQMRTAGHKELVQVGVPGPAQAAAGHRQAPDQAQVPRVQEHERAALATAVCRHPCSPRGPAERAPMSGLCAAAALQAAGRPDYKR